MNAVEFVKQLRRMDEKGVLKNCFIYPCVGRETDSPEDVVAEVEQWAKEHPVKTRQSEFLKIFPNAPLYSGVVGVDPCKVDETFECKYYGDRSSKCRRNYWLQGVE